MKKSIVVISVLAVSLIIVCVYMNCNKQSKQKEEFTVEGYDNENEFCKFTRDGGECPSRTVNGAIKADCRDDRTYNKKVCKGRSKEQCTPDTLCDWDNGKCKLLDRGKEILKKCRSCEKCKTSYDFLKFWEWPPEAIAFSLTVLGLVIAILIIIGLVVLVEKIKKIKSGSGSGSGATGTPPAGTGVTPAVAATGAAAVTAV